MLALLVTQVTVPARRTDAESGGAIALAVHAVLGRAFLFAFGAPEAVVAAMNAMAVLAALSKFLLPCWLAFSDHATMVAQFRALAVGTSVARLATARAVHLARAVEAKLAARLVAAGTVQTILAFEACTLELIARAITTIWALLLAIRKREPAGRTPVAFAVNIALLIFAILAALVEALQTRGRVLL